MAPTGVEALNSSRCFLHSTREREVDIREIVYAREVGAAGHDGSIIYQRVTKEDRCSVPLCTARARKTTKVRA